MSVPRKNPYLTTLHLILLGKISILLGKIPIVLWKIYLLEGKNPQCGWRQPRAVGVGQRIRNHCSG